MLEDILRSGFEELGIACDSQAYERFRAYYTDLDEVNKVMNLTAITGEEDSARLHFLDCAALLRYVDLSGKSVIDVGTGAGFPGLVLKIVDPSAKLTLLDSLDKRISFLESVCRRLGLDDVSCIHARAEEIPPAMRESFDVVTSRAVAGLNVLSEMCLPFVKPGGVFVAMKGPEFDEELESAKSAIKELGGKTESCETYTIPGTDIRHSVIIIRKKHETPSKYPRRWAQIKKKPL